MQRMRSDRVGDRFSEGGFRYIGERGFAWEAWAAVSWGEALEPTTTRSVRLDIWPSSHSITKLSFHTNPGVGFVAKK